MSSFKILPHLQCLRFSDNEGLRHYVVNKERAAFLQSFRVQKLISSGLVVASAACALNAVHLLAVGSAPLIALAWTVASIALVKFWQVRSNDPTRLAEAAWQAMLDNPDFDSCSAIDCI